MGYRATDFAHPVPLCRRQAFPCNRQPGTDGRYCAQTSVPDNLYNHHISIPVCVMARLGNLQVVNLTDPERSKMS